MGRSAFLSLFLDLIPGPGSTGGTHGATDDGSRRSGDRATDERACDATAKSTRSGASFIITFGSLTGDRTTDGADCAADDGPDRAADDHADGRAAESPGTSAQGFGAALLVLRRRTVVVKDGVVVGMSVSGHRVVIVVHNVLLSRAVPETGPGPPGA